MPNTLTDRAVCTGPCPYDTLHLVGVDECVYDARGTVKRGCGREIVYDGPAQLLRVNGFAQVTRTRDAADDSIRVFFSRAMTSVTLIVRRSGDWTALVATPRFLADDRVPRPARDLRRAARPRLPGRPLSVTVSDPRGYLARVSAFHLSTR
jgi:hypothetical protein